ncbi:hypothetical protein ACFWWC_48680 [Streptomyces sp. NPDC058642]|uniref:hypothetical protein n=1 Tax=Streptomyces sp. NPDC058642 TaxID=3346572 RepID=UPI00365B6EDC
MSDPTSPNPSPAPEPNPIPPMETIEDSKRQPPRRRPTGTVPRPSQAPIRTRDDIPPGALAAGVVLGILTLLVILKVAIPMAINWSKHQDWSWATQWAATLTDPVHVYLDTHTAGLPVTATSVFAIWLGASAASLSLAWLTQAVGARLTWFTHGAATVFMVWASSPAASRTVAAGLAVLAWTGLSLFALRGLSLRPVINIPPCDRRY